MSTDRYTGQKGELNFENDLVDLLIEAGWKDGVLNNLTVSQHGNFDINNITSLEGNLRKIIFENNRKELNNIELSDTEFRQIMEQIERANAPVKANMLINGKLLSVIRDTDSKDTDNAGKTIYVNIFEQAQIGTGTTRYQIARQTKYETGTYVNDRRGDITLLINGLPVIHLELKAQNVLVSEACNQIVKYAKEGVFTGLMGLVQVFFAINPSDVVYFANFGNYANYNEVFAFHWADEKNEVIKDWKTLIINKKYALLSIPEAHTLIGYYTVADRNKDVLKVMRPYQYYAVKAICVRTSKQKWGNIEPLGGINWCTTGGGKTMTSFKAGQMIRDLCLADKVVFVVDRIELNNQSLDDYNSFSREGESVQETVNGTDLFEKLSSTNSKNTLIITSIQKMNKICDELTTLKQIDMTKINAKRIVFIVDEAQRSQFGLMHERVKNTFSTALFFGFTGTPIMGESEEDVHDTRKVFGDYISVYTIASGIRDGNVLGFDPKAVSTYKDNDLRDAVALRECNATTVKEAKKDPEKYRIYRKFRLDMKMSDTFDKNGNIIKGIESYLPKSQYNNVEHRKAVVSYILENWDVLAIGEKGTRFHALLATSSIPEAIEYYKLFKSMNSGLNVTTIFDSNLGNTNLTSTLNKQSAIQDILKDYNVQYNTSFNLKNDPDLKNFKKDIMARLAHKKPYEHIGSDKAKVIDICIVVNQLLTGYDSQYINTLYLDTVINSSGLIQAISRTNRVYDKEEKPFGIFRFFRKVHTMQDNLDEALRLYCEGDSAGVVVATIEENIKEMNNLYVNIKKLFDRNNIKNYIRLPNSDADCNEFRRLFINLKGRLIAVRLQGGLVVKKLSDMEVAWDTNSVYAKKLEFSDEIYNLLCFRYYDLTHRKSQTNGVSGLGFNLNTIISEIEMEKINIDYLEQHFRLIVPILVDVEETVMNKDEAIKDLINDFGKLTERQQKYGKLVLEDIKNGRIEVEEDKSLIGYISDYISSAINSAIHNMALRYGINEDELRDLIDSKPTEYNINDGQRFTRLCENRDKEKTMKYYNTSTGKSAIKMQQDLKTFIFEEINII